jgi:membrane protein implicated in regulation of membrane protease activity
MTMPETLSPWVWATGALVIALLELQVPGSYLIWVGLGAGITAAIAFTSDISLSAQLGWFIAATTASCAAGYFVYKRLAAAQSRLPVMNQRELDIIGTKGTASESFANGRGKVRLGDSVWMAEGPDVTEGEPIIVVGLRGTTVVIARAV